MTTQLDLSLHFSGGGLTFSAEGLPPGLSIDPATGIVFGAPTAIGASTVTVTAANESGEAFASFSWRIEAASLPVNAAAPEILGAATVGGSLTVAPGSWTGQPAPTFGYQWLQNGVAIPGETGETYLATAADVGGALSVEVTASNSLGAASATSDPVVISGVSFATELTLSPFATGPGGAAPVFSGRREQNSGLVLVSGAGQPGEVVQGRMVRAADGAAVSPWMDIATADAGNGAFEGWIEGAPRSFDALRAQVRYRDAGNAPAATPNTCHVGWVMSLFAQSDQRWLGDTTFEGVSLTPTVALADNAVRVISLARDAITPAPVTAAQLLVFDVAGAAPAGRDPVWRFANTLAETLDDGPIVVMGHAVSGTNDRQTVNDSDNGRFWEDEVLIAQAGQPHLIETDRPVALDLVYWAYSSSANYNTAASALGVTGRVAFGLDPSGNPVPPGTAITDLGGSFNYVQHHSWAEIYDWAHTRLAFKQHPDAPVVAAQEAFIGHPVYGQYVIGFPAAFSAYWLTNGTRAADGTWFDGGHSSINQIGGASEIAALAAAGMARAVGAYDPGPLVLDYIDWPTASGDDPKYVHVGIGGRDVTTMRALYAEQTPPVAIGGDPVLGGVLGFTVNGTRTVNTALAAHEGFQRIRIGKQDGSDWTNADTLAYETVSINYGDLVGVTPDQGRDTLSRFQDFPIVESGLVSKPGMPVSDRVAAGLFANQIPAPAGASLVHLGSFEPGGINSTPVTIGSIVSDGRPILIALGTRGTSNIENGTFDFPATITLGGVDIGAALVARQDRMNIKASVYYIAAPATGALDLVATMNTNTFVNVAQAFHVANGAGLGSVSQVGVSAGGTINPALVSSAAGSTLVNVLVTEVVINSVAGGYLAAPIQGTGGGAFLGMAVATTVVPGVGEKTTTFGVAGFNDTVQLGVEVRKL